MHVLCRVTFRLIVAAGLFPTLEHLELLHLLAAYEVTQAQLDAFWREARLSPWTGGGHGAGVGGSWSVYGGGRGNDWPELDEPGSVYGGRGDAAVRKKAHVATTGTFARHD